MNLNSKYQIKLIGYCSLDKEAILNKFITEGTNNLNKLDGEYLIVIEGENESCIVTSPYGICQYYYTIKENQLFHADTVIEVIKKSRIPWVWNWTALADLTLLDHLLENNTLHSQVHRVPPASILHFKNGNLQIFSLNWQELNPPVAAKADVALKVFNDTVKTWLTDKAVVSMSGGFDSRVILSSCLQNGCKPLLLTMGFENSTDVVISRQIADALGLELSVINLSIDNYLNNGKKIVALTNGTKTARHWHTYLYTHQANIDRDSRFFIGTNGEFARTFYFDKGRKAIIENLLSPAESLRKLWQQKLRSIFTIEELKNFNPEFSQQFNDESRNNRIERIISLCHDKFLPGLDRFYLEQRVKNFMGNGLKLYSENVFWIAPFLSKEWVNTIWNLNRTWKLGSNWHRFAIAKNYPKLLDFPEEGKAERMYPKAPRSYWESKSNKYPVVSYANYPEWFQTDIISEFILDNAALLADIVDIKTIKSIIEEHKIKKNRTSVIAFLVTMIFWSLNLKEIREY